MQELLRPTMQIASPANCHCHPALIPMMALACVSAAARHAPKISLPRRFGQCARRRQSRIPGLR